MTQQEDKVPVITCDGTLHWMHAGTKPQALGTCNGQCSIKQEDHQNG